MNKLVSFKIICNQCNKKNIKTTNYIDNYDKPIIKSFWCNYCGKAQVLTIRFVNGFIDITDRIKPSTIYIPKKPETGITIKPKTK